MTGGRPSTEGLTASLWTSGLVEVDLPSGISVRGVRPTLAELSTRGLLPTHLQQVALRDADPSWLTSSDDDQREKAENAIAAIRLLVARFPQYVKVGTKWVRDETPLDQRIAAISSTDDAVRMDALDYDFLENIVLRIWTPEEATERAHQFTHGVWRPQAEADEPADATFRPESGGAEAGTDGAVLAPTPIRPNRSQRRRASVPARRGTHAA